MSNSNAHGSQISDQNEALRRENADLYAQIKALSQRLAQGSAGEFAAAACLHCRVSRSRAWSLEPRPGGTIHRGQRRPPLTSRLGESSGVNGGAARDADDLVGEQGRAIRWSWRRGCAR